MKPASQHPAVSGATGALAARTRQVQGGSGDALARRTPAAGKRAAAAQPGGSYDVDDEVFFRHAEGPRSGRVVARGRHGCTVDEPCGRRHQIAWDGFLGLKGRQTYPARVVDRGAGGAIMEREDGRRFFVAGDVPAAEEPDALSWDESGTPAPLEKADPVALLGHAIAGFGARWSAEVLEPPARPLLFIAGGRARVR